jgi:hypothetical protein
VDASARARLREPRLWELKMSLEVLEARARPLEVLLGLVERREVRVVEKRVEEGNDAGGRDREGFRGASRGKDVEEAMA